MLVRLSSTARSIARCGCDYRPVRADNCRKLCPILVALLISLSACNTPNDRVFEEAFDQVDTIAPDTAVTIQNGEGAVLVYGSETTEMRVHAIKKAYSRSRLAQIAIDVSVKAGSVSITTKFPPKPKWGLFDRSGTVDYTIVLPATTNISGLELDAGEVLLDGMRGPAARVRLGEGRMFVRNCFADTNLTVRRGNLILSYDWWEKANVSAEASIARGNVWAYFPTDAAFHLLAEAKHGTIASDFKGLAAEEPQAGDGMKIDASVNGGSDATIKIGVTQGNITIVKAGP
jgi:hypothetical protein